MDTPVPKSHNKLYVLILVGMCTVILSALAFEHIGGYQPCKLCLEQRWPWYLGIPVALLSCISLALGWPAKVTRGLMLLVGLILLYSLFLGVRHAGIEWGFWEGPGDCGVVDGGLATNTSDLFKQLEENVPPSCTEASLRVLGLSFAGWNALVSLLLAVLAIRTALSAGTARLTNPGD